MPASAAPPEKQALFKYKTQTSSCPAENHFNTNPPPHTEMWSTFQIGNGEKQNSFIQPLQSGAN